MSSHHMVKYSVPSIDTALLSRNSLTSSMNTLASRGILYVNAPAGYGKTTAVIQWLLSNRFHAAWFSLDTYDITIGDFCRGLLLALSAYASPETAHTLQSMIAQAEFAPSPLPHTMELLSHFQYQTIPDALVLDDFHLCQDPTASLSFQAIRNRLPASLRVVIVSRNPPSGGLNELLLKNVLHPITIDDLQFSRDEINSFFQRRGIRLTAYLAEQLHKKTGGWPAALHALALSERGEKRITLKGRVTNNTYLWEYLRKQIYDRWDEKTKQILIRTSLCDAISPELCEMITEQPDGWEILTDMSQKTGLITKWDAHTYRYHALLREFLLSGFEAENEAARQALYHKLAVWYIEHNDMLAALDIALKSGDLALVEDIQRQKSEYGQYSISVESYAEAVTQNVLCKMPTEVIRKFPRLSLDCLFAAFLSGKPEEAKKWRRIVREHIHELRMRHTADIIVAALQCALDPEKDSWHVPGQLRKMRKYIHTSCADRKTSSFTMTFNMPFFHKAQRDYTDISPCLDAYLAEIEKRLVPFLGPVYEQLANLLEAGICFERNDIPRAWETLKRSESIMHHTTPEIRYAYLTLICEMHWIAGDSDALKESLEETDALITQANAFYLSANFNAYRTNLLLYKGDAASAEAWLGNGPGISKHPLKLFQSYQNLVTARALMVMNKLDKADSFLERIADFAVRYRRNADWIEARTLHGMCLWRMRDEDGAAEKLTSAILKAQELELPMPVMREGADILPILLKIQNRFKFGYENKDTDPGFLNTLCVNARRLGRLYKGLSAKADRAQIRLSVKQDIVLKLLAQKMSYREMSEATGTKITTITDHVVKIYRKLGVTNSTEALLKARELGLIK